jgi:acetyl/propionyl-CoA carboxylase alpha subunit
MMSKLLIANRGEIAVRIIATAKDMGITTVAVAPADDSESLHRARADEFHELVGSGPSAYLDIEQIVRIAVESGCDAIHPGYGFASEHPAFASACAAAGVTFVGPGADTLKRLGDKVAAIGLASELGLPVSVHTRITEPDDLEQLLGSVGGRVMLKAVSGGGGRGMRVVAPGDDVAEAIERCRSEAATSFGDDDLYAEAFLEDARHVEVQIIGDGTGAVVVLGDRDCSLQRRRQKMMEFAPAPGLSEATRNVLMDAAVKMASHVKYLGLATFEFLVAVDGTVAFMEANARLQVEHTITEAVTGLDLVELQLRVVSGATLPDVGLVPGHSPPTIGAAAQARVNMERIGRSGDAHPTGGTLSRFTVAAGHGVRVDTYGASGYETNPRYDSLLAKVIVTGHDHASALVRLDRALNDCEIEGVETNIGFLLGLARAQPVRDGLLHTQLLENLAPSIVAALPEAVAVAPGAIDEVGGTDASVRAPLQGTNVSITVDVGDEVPAGAQLLVMEAMKMEHVITAPTSGVVLGIGADVGDAVLEGHMLIDMAGADVSAEVGAQELAVDPDYIRPDLAEAIDRHEIGLDHRRPDAVERRRKLSRRTTRENLDDLVDDGSFVEYGALAIAPQRRRRSVQELIEKTPADGMVSGIGRVNSDIYGEMSRCAVVSYDYTVLAGTQGGQNHRKKDRLFELAEKHRLPVVLFAEGGGGRPGDTDGMGVAGLDVLAFLLFGELSGLVPLVGINTGYCFAGNAALLGMCDVVIATRDSNVGMGGPAMIEGGGLGVYHPTEVGPAEEQFAIGVIDVLVNNDVEAVAAAKQYLSYFQGSHDSWEAPDQRLLRHVIPENRLRVYDVREVISLLADVDSVLELRAGWGPGMITSLARIEGRPVGIVANNPLHLAGAIDSDGADKAARFMQLCDAFDVPIVFLCDTPGIMVGPEAERSGTVRHAARMFVTGAGIDIPFGTIVLRKGYGLGAQAMAGGSFKAPMFTVSWPTGEFGGMGLEGAVRLGYRNELEAIEDPDERAEAFQQRVDRMYTVGKALNFASAFELDDVIDPADTRSVITRAFSLAARPPERTSKKRPNVDTW